MSEYPPKLVWPKEYTPCVSNTRELEKVVRVTPNLHLRITLGTEEKDSIPEYIFWPDVMWYPTLESNGLPVYMESETPVSDEIEAIKLLETWLSDFYLQINNTNVFKNETDITTTEP